MDALSVSTRSLNRKGLPRAPFFYPLLYCLLVTAPTFRYSSVGRDCYLYARDKKYIQDIRITPDLDSQYKDDMLNIAIDLKGNGTVALDLTDAQGNSVATADLKGSGKLNTTLSVANPAK